MIPKFKRKILFLLLIFIHLLTAWAGETKAPHPGYSLGDLIKGLEQHNLLLEISSIDKKIASAEYKEHRALSNPEVELSTGEAKVPGEAGSSPVWSAGVKMSVPNPIYRYYFLRSHRSHITQAAIEAGIKKQELLRGLKVQFYDLQFYRKSANLLQEKISRLEEIYRITKAKASIGEAKEIDYLRASVKIQETRSALFKTEKNAASGKNKINEYLNYTLPKDFTIVEDFSFAPLQGIEGKIEQLLEKSPLLVLKRNHLEGKSAGVKAGRWALLEGFEVFGEREQEVDAKIWRIGVGLSIPIFNCNTAHLEKAKYEAEKARKELEHARKHLLADIERMMSEIRVLEKEIETFTGAVLAAGRENMELSGKLYKEGEIPLVVFLDSQDSYFDLELRYYEAICEWLTAKASLEELLALELD